MQLLGIDFGGSGIKGAPVNTETGEFTAERIRFETPFPAAPEPVAELVKKIAEHFDWKGNIGIGFPAAVQNGIVRTAANIDKSWIGLNGNQLFSTFTGLPVKIVNDADAAGLAEMNFGEGKDAKGVTLLLTIGTGIGSVLFKDGIMIPNTEFGHLKYKKSVVEKYASDAVRKAEDLSWSEWGKRLNKVLQHMYGLCYPDLIILGGGVSKKFDKIEEYIKLECPVKPAKLLNDAGIIGAAMFAK